MIIKHGLLLVLILIVVPGLVMIATSATIHIAIIRISEIVMTLRVHVSASTSVWFSIASSSSIHLAIAILVFTVVLHVAFVLRSLWSRRYFSLSLV